MNVKASHSSHYRQNLKKRLGVEMLFLYTFSIRKQVVNIVLGDFGKG